MEFICLIYQNKRSVSKLTIQGKRLCIGVASPKSERVVSFTTGSIIVSQKAQYFGYLLEICGFPAEHERRDSIALSRHF
jgi:hypothetical protein